MPQHLKIDLGDGRESETPLEGMSGGCRVPAQTLVRREALLSMCSAELLGRSRIRLRVWSQRSLEGPDRLRLVSGTNWVGAGTSGSSIEPDQTAVQSSAVASMSSRRACRQHDAKKIKGEVETEVIKQVLVFPHSIGRTANSAVLKHLLRL